MKRLLQAKRLRTKTLMYLDGRCCVKSDVDCYRIHCTERKYIQKQFVDSKRFFFRSSLRWVMPMSKLAETIKKNDFQNSHTFNFEMGFFHLGCCLSHGSYKTYFYHHLSRQNLYLCSTFLDHITLLLLFFVLLLLLLFSCGFHPVCLSVFFQWKQTMRK